jgi:hypothetical protein
LQEKGGMVYVEDDDQNPGQDETRARKLKESEEDGIIFTKLGIAFTKENASKPKKRTYKELTLDSRTNVSELQAAIGKIESGTIVKVHLGKEYTKEQLLALNGLPTSAILIFVSSEILDNGIERDITEISICGINLFKGLFFTPKTKEDLAAKELGVANRLVIGRFDQYKNGQEISEDMKIVASGDLTGLARNQKFFEAVLLHLHKLDNSDLHNKDELKKMFLEAVADRVRMRQARAEEGYLWDFEDPDQEILLSTLMAKHEGTETIDTIIQQFNDGKKPRTAEEIRLELSRAVKRLQQLSGDLAENHPGGEIKIWGKPVKLPSDLTESQVMGAIIELLKLNAGQSDLTQLNEKDNDAPRVDAIKAILEAA